MNLEPLLRQLSGSQFGVKFKDGNRNVDSGVQELAEALIDGIRASMVAPIDVRQPIVLNNRTNGPAIVINNAGSVDHHGIWIQNESGETVKLGIGLGSEGILANEFIAHPSYLQDPETVHRVYSDVAGGDGGATLVPGAKPAVPFVAPGPGYVFNNAIGSTKDNGSYASPGTRVGSGYGQGKAGSGIPGDLGNRTGVFIANAGVGEMLSQFEFSGDNLKLTFNGTQYNVPSYTPLESVALDDLTDVTISSIGDGEFLTWSSGMLINQTVAELDLLTVTAADAAYQPLDSDLTAIAAANNGSVLAATTGTFTSADETKLDGIEAGADVTDATNVDAAGAVMNSDATTASMSFVVDEDDMASNLSTKVPTQQSVKSYVDSNSGESYEVYDAGNSGSSINIDWADGNLQTVTLTASPVDVVFTSTPDAGRPVFLHLIQDGTGSRTVNTWTYGGTGDETVILPSTWSYPLQSAGESVLVEAIYEGTDIRLRSLVAYGT